MTAQQLEEALRKVCDNSGLAFQEVADVLETLSEEMRMLAADEQDA